MLKADHISVGNDASTLIHSADHGFSVWGRKYRDTLFLKGAPFRLIWRGREVSESGYIRRMTRSTIAPASRDENRCADHRKGKSR
jgi:hypothetical protein